MKPVDVYNAYGHLYEMYIPCGSRLVQFHRGREMGSYSHRYKLNISLNKDMPCISAKELMLEQVTYVTWEPDEQWLGMREDDPYRSYWKAIGNTDEAWRLHLIETIQAHPSFQRGSSLSKHSFYAYETFIVDDNLETLYWTTYGLKPTWKPLSSLNELNPNGLMKGT